MAAMDLETDLDPDACHRALSARDPRFDGRLFVGVTSTGVYCRPICPARTPKPENTCFFTTAAAAEAAAAGASGSMPMVSTDPPSAHSL